MKLILFIKTYVRCKVNERRTNLMNCFTNIFPNVIVEIIYDYENSIILDKLDILKN